MEHKMNIKPVDLSSVADPLASNEEKLLDSYGIKIARAIQDEWFGGGMISKDCLFYNRHQWINEMRLYNRGEQDVEKYKEHMARQKMDISWLNLDWTPINVAEKYTNIVRNGISDDYYRLDVRSADKFSLLQRQENIKRHRTNMASKKMLERAKQLMGIDLVPKGFIPEDEDELNLYTEIKERPKQEIAEEIMINFVKSVSYWDHIKKEADKDLVVSDLMVARVYTDPVNGVMVEYVDPERYGHSYVERNDFKDAYYHFVVDTVTIGDLKRESGYRDSDLRKIAQSYAAKNESFSHVNFETALIDDFVNVRVHVMRFCFKSSKEIRHKVYYDKKGKPRKVARRGSDYEVPEGKEDSKLVRIMDTWYEGNYVVGSDKYIYGYKESENIAVDEMDRVLPPFIAQSSNIYKNKLKSFLSNIIPLCDEMQYTHLKIQHLRAELKPDLVVIDLDQLAELNSDTSGESKEDNWKMALSILNTKGIVIQQRTNMGEDGIKDGPSARPMGNQQGSALAALLNIWAHYYNLIRETTGINPARDGSLSPDALVGVNQMMQLASNTATKHIVEASVAWDKRICETISTRLKGIFCLDEAKHLQEMYERAIGKENIEALESLKDRSLHDFGFVVEMVPAKEEIDELKQDLALALQDGSIDVSEKAEIIRIARSNMKQAYEYMRFMRKRKIKERMEELEHNNQLQAQNNMMAAQAKMEGDIKVYGAQKQIDAQLEGNKTMMRIKEYQAKKEIDAPIEDKKFQQQVYIEQIKNLQTLSLTKYKEDAKADREVENSTRQSKMIEQRQKDKEAIDFSNKFSLADILK